MDSCLYGFTGAKGLLRRGIRWGTERRSNCLKNGAPSCCLGRRHSVIVFALAATAILDALGQGLNLVVGIALFGHLFADLAIGVDHRGVVLAAELLANLGQG